MVNSLQRTILIVEDDTVTARIIEKNIQATRFSVAGVTGSGDSALKMVKELNPSIILMDIGLEGAMDGIETARALQEQVDSPAVVFITASTDEETLSRAKECHPYGYIIKPIDREELNSTLEVAFSRFQTDIILRESEEKYSTILNSITDSVIVTNQQNRITYMNSAAIVLTGWKLEDVLNREIFEVLSIISDESNQQQTSLTRLSRLSLQTKEQKIIPIELTSTPILSRDNRRQGTVAVIRDNTERVNYEKEIQDSMGMLRQTMSGTIQAMVQTVESRDPYTAGHQRRVADIARRIAVEMELESQHIEGIRLAGVIHDLGKISVPAEILSKPGRLLEPEFNLIKIHPQIGYDILKSVEFPWPVADIVHQHHERLDGTGYPNGLKGDEILMESKIIAVADVVEAMASHRPYRAALGIDLALGEIEDKSGTFFEPDIVDACCTLFRERGFDREFTQSFS